MIQFKIEGKSIVMGKFFGSNDKSSALEIIGDVKKVLFVDTPSTEHLAAMIEELQGKGVECIVRDHHDCPSPRNPREEQIRDAAVRVRTLVNDAVISTREANPACSSLMSAGEFADTDVVVADPDLDGLLGTMKALGVVYPELDSDAAVLDGPRSEQTPDKLSDLALLLTKGLASLPPFDKDRPHIAENTKGEYYLTFVKASQGDAEAKSSLEQKVEAYEAGVEVAKELISNASEAAQGVVLVDTVGYDRYDLGTLTRGIERDGVKITVIKKTFGPIAKVAGEGGVQYSLAVVRSCQDQINLQELLPQGFESSPEAGIISNTSFLLHVSEQVWNDTVLPALQK